MFLIKIKESNRYNLEEIKEQINIKKSAKELEKQSKLKFLKDKNL